MAEPSAADTVQILRGIADKYATFHGVRVHDRALVAAAELSERYIQGRFREWPQTPFPALRHTTPASPTGYTPPRWARSLQCGVWCQAYEMWPHA